MQCMHGLYFWLIVSWAVTKETHYCISHNAWNEYFIYLLWAFHETHILFQIVLLALLARKVENVCCHFCLTPPGHNILLIDHFEMCMCVCGSARLYTNIVSSLALASFFFIWLWVDTSGETRIRLRNCCTIFSGAIGKTLPTFAFDCHIFHTVLWDTLIWITHHMQNWWIDESDPQS